MEGNEARIKKILTILTEISDDDLEIISRALHEIVRIRKKSVENADGCDIMNMDDEENGWWTTENGKHYHVGENGEVDKGPNFLKGKPIDHTKASKSSKKESPDAKSSETSKAVRGGDFPKEVTAPLPGDKIKFKKEWLNPGEDPNEIYEVIEANPDTKRMKVKLLNPKPGSVAERWGHTEIVDYSMAENAEAPRNAREILEQAGKDIHGSINATKEAPEPNETVGGYLGGGDKVTPGKGLKAGSRSKSGHIVIDTADAVGEKDKDGSLKDNSLRKYVDADGNLSEERQAEHDRILDDCFKGKTPEKEGKRKMTMLGGGPASGKSSAVRAGLFEVGSPETSVTIDPDGLKAKLPGYREMAAESDEAAGYYHEESSALAKSEYSEALDSGYNALYDGTGDGSPKSVRKKIQQARDAGYAVEGRYVTVDTEEAIRRNQARYDNAKKKYDEAKNRGEEAEPPRLPDPDLVRETHQNVTDCAVECAKDYDTFALYDNNGDHNVHQIATGGNGQGIKAVPGYEQELQNFLNKGKGKYKVRSDGTVEVIESPFKK